MNLIFSSGWVTEIEFSTWLESSAIITRARSQSLFIYLYTPSRRMIIINKYLLPKHLYLSPELCVYSYESSGCADLSRSRQDRTIDHTLYCIIAASTIIYVHWYCIRYVQLNFVPLKVYVLSPLLFVRSPPNFNSIKAEQRTGTKLLRLVKHPHSSVLFFYIIALKSSFRGDDLCPLQLGG